MHGEHSWQPTQKRPTTQTSFQHPVLFLKVLPVIYVEKKNESDKWRTFHTNSQEWNLSQILPFVSPGHGVERPRDRVSRITSFLVLDMAWTHRMTLAPTLPLSRSPTAHLQNVVVVPEVSQMPFAALMNRAWNSRLLNSDSLLSPENPIYWQEWIMAMTMGSSVGECSQWRNAL